MPKLTAGYRRNCFQLFQPDEELKMKAIMTEDDIRRIHKMSRTEIASFLGMSSLDIQMMGIVRARQLLERVAEVGEEY